MERSWLCESLLPSDLIEESRWMGADYSSRITTRINGSWGFRGGESNSLMASKGEGEMRERSLAFFRVTMPCAGKATLHPSIRLIQIYQRGYIYIYIYMFRGRIVRDCNWSSWCLLDLGKSVSRNGRHDAVWVIRGIKITKIIYLSYSFGIMFFFLHLLFH